MILVHHDQRRVKPVFALVLAGEELNHALLVGYDYRVLVYLAPLEQAGAGLDVPRAGSKQQAGLLAVAGGDENLAAVLAKEALVGSDYGTHRRFALFPRQGQQAPLILPPAVRPLGIKQAVEVLFLPRLRHELVAGERRFRMFEQPGEFAYINPRRHRRIVHPQGRV